MTKELQKAFVVFLDHSTEKKALGGNFGINMQAGKHPCVATEEQK